MSTKTKVETKVPPPSAQELALQEQNLAIAKEQLTAIQRSNEFQQQQFEAVAPFFEDVSKRAAIRSELLTDPEREQIARADIERELRLGPLQEELLNLELENIRRGGAASPEQIDLINQATEAQLALGGSDIDRFTQQGLGLLREELAPSLGLRPGDQPILDRGGRLAEEGLRQKGQLERSLRGGAATAQLNLPLALGQLQSAQTGGQQNIAQAAEAFKADLRNTAFNNRLRALGQAPSGQFSLGLANQLRAERFGSSTQTSGTSGLGAQQAGAIIGGIGVAAAASSKDFKENNKPVDHKDILKKIKELQVEKWNYKGDNQEHIGPMAEDFKRIFGLGDGKSIPFVDMFGILLSGMKALEEKNAIRT